MCVTLRRGKYGESVGFRGGRSLRLPEKERAREMRCMRNFVQGWDLIRKGVKMPN